MKAWSQRMQLCLCFKLQITVPSAPLFNWKMEKSTPVSHSGEGLKPESCHSMVVRPSVIFKVGNWLLGHQLLPAPTCPFTDSEALQSISSTLLKPLIWRALYWSLELSLQPSFLTTLNAVLCAGLCLVSKCSLQFTKNKVLTACPALMNPLFWRCQAVHEARLNEVLLQPGPLEPKYRYNICKTAYCPEITAAVSSPTSARWQKPT